MSQQPQLCSKCVSGVEHEGQAKGKIIKVGGDFEAYEAVPSGDYDKSKVLLLLTDAFGVELNNNKLLADGFANNGLRTVVPEYFQQDAVPKDAMSSGAKFDIMAWIGRHGPETVYPALNAAIDHVKSEGVTSIGAIGYCFGGRYVFNLAFEHRIQVAAVGHPSLLQVPEDLHKYKDTGVPILFLTNEFDGQFPPEKQEQADAILGPLGSDKYLRKYWAGMDHGFAVRGDMSDPKQKKAKEEAFEEATNWFLSKL